MEDNIMTNQDRKVAGYLSKVIYEADQAFYRMRKNREMNEDDPKSKWIVMKLQNCYIMITSVIGTNAAHRAAYRIEHNFAKHFKSPLIIHDTSEFSMYININDGAYLKMYDNYQSIKYDCSIAAFKCPWFRGDSRDVIMHLTLPYEDKYKKHPLAKYAIPEYFDQVPDSNVPGVTHSSALDVYYDTLEYLNDSRKAEGKEFLHDDYNWKDFCVAYNAVWGHLPEAYKDLKVLDTNSDEYFVHDGNDWVRLHA